MSDFEKCPFCAEDNSAPASVCAHCNRDLRAVTTPNVVPPHKNLKNVMLFGILAVSVCVAGLLFGSVDMEAAMETIHPNHKKSIDRLDSSEGQKKPEDDTHQHEKIDQNRLAAQAPQPFNIGDEVQVIKNAVLAESVEAYKELQNASWAKDKASFAHLFKIGKLSTCNMTANAVVQNREALDPENSLCEVRLRTGELAGLTVWVKSKDLRKP